MPAQPDLLASEKVQELPALVRPTLGVKIALCLWMTGVFMFYLLMYTPPFVIAVAEKIGVGESLSTLQEKVRPFFQTSDFSEYMKDPTGGL